LTSLVKFVRNIQNVNMDIETFWKLRSPAIGSGSKLWIRLSKSLYYKIQKYWFISNIHTKWPRGGIGRHKGLLQVNKHLKTNLVVLSDISMGKYQFPFKEQLSRLGSVPPTKSLGPKRPCRFDSGRGYKEIT